MSHDFKPQSETDHSVIPHMLLGREPLPAPAAATNAVLPGVADLLSTWKPRVIQMDNNPTIARDAMLHRMAMATPGGPQFPTKPVDLFRETCAPRPQAKPFDEAQAYATGSRAVMEVKKGPLPCHPMLLSQLARDAGPIRAALDRGETVVITAGGRELARYEP